MPFHLLDHVKAKSKLELARRIHAEWNKLSPKDDVPKAVAISNRLGDLENDRGAWWLSEERPAARQAFERVTGVSLRELPLAHTFVSSPDFPELRPLRPGADEPLPLATPNWFAPPGTLAAKLWIVAPPGSGRSLAVQWHRIRGSARAEEVTSLADAVGFAAVDAPLLISIDGPPTENDAATLVRLDGCRELTIIATFPRPTMAGSDRTLRALEPIESRRDEQEPDEPGWSEHSPASHDEESVGTEERPWKDERWQPVPGWRDLLVQSVVTRIEDRETLLDAEQTLDWLAKTDPREVTFGTPGDIVSLCAIVHQSGIGAFRRDIVTPLLHSRTKGVASTGGPAETWLRAWGADAIRGMVESRLRDVTLPLWAPLPRERWRSLVPDNLAAAAMTEDEIDRLLDHKRTPRREAKRLLRQRSAPEVIELLSEARILRPHASGLVLRPRWLGLAVARDAVRNEILHGAPATWGRWAADRDRRSIVDSELDHIVWRDLEEVAAQVCGAFDSSSLGAVGAVEATFAAVGRRLGPDARGPAALLRLWDLQRRLLAPRYKGDDPFPLTRPGPETDSDWVACCWRWSLYGPRTTVDDHLAWLFPGWCSPTLANLTPLAHKNIGEPGWGADGITEPRGSFPQVLAMADEVVSRATDANLPDDVPACLLPSILLAAHRRTPRWQLSYEHLSNLAGRAWTGAHVVHRVAALSNEDQAEVARTLWDAGAAHDGGLRTILAALQHDEELTRLVTRHLRIEDFTRVLRPNDVNALGSLAWLPARLRLPLVRYVLNTAPTVTHDLDLVLQDLHYRRRGDKPPIGADDVEWMEMLADANRSRFRGRATIWAMAPERAFARTEAAPIDSDDAADWFNAAPEHAYGRLLEHLARKNADEPLQGWLARWLRRRLADAGPAADQAFALLARAAGPVDGAP